MDQKIRDRIVAFLPLVLVLILFSISVTAKINLTASDLGRHLINGREFLQNFKPRETNYYSYTNPDFPFINHHWLSGVIFYLIFKITGFTGLSIFYLIISVITFLLFFKMTRDKIGTNLTLLISLLIIPILSTRKEIRPEIFSYLLLGIFYQMLIKFNQSKITFLKLLILPLLIILWVNLHIYFFLGIVLIGVFLIEAFFKAGLKDKKFQQLLIIIIISALAALLNPSGLTGVLSPFTIFNNYGYRVLENQPVWFLEKLITNPGFLIFKIVFIILMISWFIRILLIFKKGYPRKLFFNYFPIADLLFSLGFSLMAWLQYRNFTIFGLFCLVLLANNLEPLLVNRLKSVKVINLISQGLIIIIFLLVISGNLSLSIYQNKFGLGLIDKVNNSAEFFLKERLSGPIFNNYDIGGYLIYHLFPKEKVFVDNRPEAYPNDFFNKIYVPMQTEEKIWQKINKQYQFNAIFFNRNDATPWGQQFLISRVKDPTWAIVYVDDFVIIYLRRNHQNEQLIKKFEIPKNYFNVTD